MYLEVKLNDAQIAVGGEPGLQRLSLTVVATNASPVASFYFGGVRNVSPAEIQHVCWSDRKLRSGDRLRVTALELATASLATREYSFPMVHSAEDLLEMRTNERSPQPPSPKVSKLFKLSFGMRFSDSTSVSAVGNEETLQLVLSWSKITDRCKVEVDSLTALDDGTTRGQRLVDRLLRPKEWLDLQLAIEPNASS